MRVLLLVLALSTACAAAALAGDGTAPASQPSETNVGQPGTAGQGPAAPGQPGMAGQGPTAGVGACPPGTSVPATVGTGAAIGNEMMDTCMMNTLGLSRQQIQGLRSQGLSNSDIAMAAAISSKSGQPIGAVVASWKATGNWPDVARQYGVSMSDLTSMAGMANPDEESFNAAFVAQYYGIPVSDVTKLRQQGYSWTQINMMANAAARTGQPISQIASLRAQGYSWSQIAQQYNVPVASLMQPVGCQTVTASVPGGVSPTGTGPGAAGTPAARYSPTVGAGPAAFGSVPTPIVAIAPVMYDAAGNPILTIDDVRRYYAQGYSWVDVAIAANIYRESGYPIQNILMEQRTGAPVWEGIVYKYGVDPTRAYNVTDYPFPRYAVSNKVAGATMALIEPYQKPWPGYGPQSGTNPCACGACPSPRPCPAPCPQVCPPPCPPPCPPGTMTVPSGAGPAGTMAPYGTTQPSGTTTTPYGATQPSGTTTTPSVPPSAPEATETPSSPPAAAPGTVY